MNVINSLKQEVHNLMINDSAHDFDHIMRVFKNAQKICKKENTHEKLVLSAILLHDIVSYPKSDKRSKLSSIKSAEKSKKILSVSQILDMKLYHVIRQHLERVFHGRF